MSVPANSVRFFQRAIMLWVFVFTLSAYWGLDAMNIMGWSPPYVPPGPLKYITHAFSLLPDGIDHLVVLAAVPLLLLLCVHDIVRRPRWWTALFVWFLYTNLMNRAWLAGSGGQQLIANLLFWNIFLTRIGAKASAEQSTMLSIAFWILRLQLLLAYLATGLHKLTGTHWLDGTAMGIVATDHAFGPLWITDHPMLAAITTWCVLIVQLTFPLAVWWRPTRLAWMGIGVLFHLGTAIWMDIPEMGLAFLVAYPLWIEWPLRRRNVLGGDQVVTAQP